MADLPEALEEVLLLAPDSEDRERLALLFAESAIAIDALGTLDLSAYEVDEADVPADLDAWEHLAPVIGRTLETVNALLETLRTKLPDEAPPESADPQQRAMQEAFRRIRRIEGRLKEEVTRFGRTMRDPSIMADRWNLLNHLQSFRGRFRNAIADMVHLAASAFGEVRKDEVVPFFLRETAEGMILRRAVHRLKWDVEDLLETEPDPAERARKTLRLLAKFMYGRPWSVVRAADKRALLACRRALHDALGAPERDGAALAAPIEQLLGVLDGFRVLNERETLVLHDRGALARVERLLDDLDLVEDTEAGPAALEELLRAARTLIGRDPDLDEWLRRHRALSVATLRPDDIRALADELRAVLLRVTPP
ncbi:MAG: hypothetical protein D6729_03200 [Deltaproteobacteria bacterium]|nr:MAG: hypothetical protein D6729_03200 [Deltaproteobacteria bacterium]